MSYNKKIDVELLEPHQIQSILKAAKEVLYTGSKVICPSVRNNDIDIMLLVDDIKKFEIDNNLLSSGFYPDDDMVSYRIEEYNILLTESPGHFKLWKFATEIATGLNLTKKEDRKFLFKQLIDSDKIIIVK